MRLETQIIPDILPSELSPGQVDREFRQRLEAGAVLKPVGRAKDDPKGLLARGYGPKHKLELFGNSFYLTNLRVDANFRLFVAYVAQTGRSRVIHPRIFYKDSSLVWRSATHVIRSARENWIGKGDLKTVMQGGEEIEYGAEETTNLPFEMQAALDTISRRGGRPRRDHQAVLWVLRAAPEHRFEPYRDFSEPRRRAHADPRNRIHRDRPVARFERPGDPGSLRFVKGFEPDFEAGILGRSDSRSRLYGGDIRKFRILSSNRQIQYQFIAGPRHVWIIPPQTLTTELNSYGVRTIDVHADEDAFVPGYEYHFIDGTEEPHQLHSQIPEGYAGAASEVDPDRAEAFPWLEKLPVIQEFRRKLQL